MLFQNSFLSLLQHYSLNFDQNSKLDVFKTSTKHPSLRGQQTSSHLWGMVFFRQPFDKIRLFLLYFLRLNMSEYCILSNFSVRKLHFLEKFPFLSGFLWTRHFSLWKVYFFGEKHIFWPGFERLLQKGIRIYIRISRIQENIRIRIRIFSTCNRLFEFIRISQKRYSNISNISKFQVKKVGKSTYLIFGIRIF
jgi:hypothetical protein